MTKYEIYVPPPYAWKMRFSPHSNMILTTREGEQPNWFHRTMQKLILGFTWERIK